MAVVELERCIQLQQVLRVQFRCLRVARALMAAMAAALAAFGILAGPRRVGRYQSERCYLRLVITVVQVPLMRICVHHVSYPCIGLGAAIIRYLPPGVGRLDHAPSSRGTGTPACLEHVEGTRQAWKGNLAKQNAYSRHGNGNITNARVSLRVRPPKHLSPSTY
jgi:hypothetical protein